MGDISQMPIRLYPHLHHAIQIYDFSRACFTKTMGSFSRSQVTEWGYQFHVFLKMNSGLNLVPHYFGYFRHATYSKFFENPSFNPRY